MEKTKKQRFLQYIRNAYETVRVRKLKDYFIEKTKTIRLKIKLKAVTKAKKRESKNGNFETAATLRDQEKALLKQIDKLNSKQKKP